MTYNNLARDTSGNPFKPLEWKLESHRPLLRKGNCQLVDGLLRHRFFISSLDHREIESSQGVCHPLPGCQRGRSREYESNHKYCVIISCVFLRSLRSFKVEKQYFVVLWYQTHSVYWSAGTLRCSIKLIQQVGIEVTLRTAVFTRTIVIKSGSLRR